jgi:hypothetical protein
MMIPTVEVPETRIVQNQEYKKKHLYLEHSMPLQAATNFYMMTWTAEAFSTDPDRERINIYESLNVMPMSLGTTSLDSTKTPAIKIQMLQGEIKNLEYNMTGAPVQQA